MNDELRMAYDKRSEEILSSGRKYLELEEDEKEFVMFYGKILAKEIIDLNSGSGYYSF
jgi:hypothetical protein